MRQASPPGGAPCRGYSGIKPEESPKALSLEKSELPQLESCFLLMTSRWHQTLSFVLAYGRRGQSLPLPGADKDLKHDEDAVIKNNAIIEC